MTVVADASIEVTPVPDPPSVAGADLRVFAELARLANASCRHDAGHDHFDRPALELITRWVDRADRVHSGVLARRGGVTVGAAVAVMPLDDGAPNVEFDIWLEPNRWGEGIEESLLAAIERKAVELGRPVLQTFTIHRPGASGESIASPTGSGSVPAGDRQTRLMLDHGYVLQQVERNSVLDLAGDMAPIARMRDAAATAAGPDYRVVTWTTPTPDEHLEGYAYAISRLSTDAPTGDFVWPEEEWDGARVRRRDANSADAGLTIGVAVAIHIPTGAVAAYTELAIGEDPRSATRQWGTLVLREHRGRRLGTLVKCENLLRWTAIAPDSPRVSTFNAEENRYMLDVNEAMGFVPASYAGAWQKTVGGR
ncbi:GNAT family N-acetyltransferase [Microbacterium thalassium]|uniref:GNAT superfamily N-acetyltransferase n=1 Tax=Microbacterium thalassium TaxID=362649 RepID=A0A7X0KVK0_9MICO|nr:GNAT family N-acetyltransferase [Microbacterium thalassium]MBB6392149.1 GNAT superfamily N-acetyltransferase [Microbacterium thalassium]GLK24893.1 hypothetical protein GCM10017607_22110 [Microbacterium thalassium]